VEWEYFLKFAKKNDDLKPFRTNWKIYDKYFLLAGGVAMVFKSKHNNYYLYNWKRVR